MSSPVLHDTVSSLVRLIATGLLGMVLGMFPVAPSVHGQGSCRLMDISVEDFPLITGHFYAFDMAGKIFTGLDPRDIIIKENGVVRTVTRVTCPAPKPPDTLSSVLTIDVSASMGVTGADGTPRIEVAKAAAQAWVDAVPAPFECAVTSFDDDSYINSDLTDDKSRLTAAISGLRPDGGTDYSAGFLGDPGGGIRVVRRGQYKRIVVFLTDGIWHGKPDVIIQEARRSNVTIYSIVLDMGVPGILREISEKTGGAAYSIRTKEEAAAIYRTILYQAQGIEPCEIEWESVPNCEAARNVTMEIPGLGARTQDYYTAPVTRSSMLLSPEMLQFGAIRPGATRSFDVRVVASGDTVTLDSIVSDNPNFTVTYSGGQLKIPPGKTVLITVTFSAVDSSQAYGKILFYSNDCRPRELPVTGGFHRNTGGKASLRLLHPNGGERFVAGVDTVITWTGILPTSLARLEFSTNAGATWTTVSDRATGLSRPWRVPNTPSDSCLMRISERRPETPVVTLTGHNSTVLDAGFNRNASMVCTIEYDGTIRVFDAATGDLLNTISGHPSGVVARFNPRMDEILTVGADLTARLWNAGDGSIQKIIVGFVGPLSTAAYNAAGTMIVVAGRDTAVKLWSGSFFKIFPIRWPVRSVAIDVNESVVGAGADDGLAYLWNLSTDTLIRTLGPHTGPVTSIDFDVTGNHIVTADGGAVYLWDAMTGRLIWSAGRGTPRTARFSPDGLSILVAGSNDVFILETYTGTVIRTLSGHTQKTTTAYYNFAGDRAVSASEDGTVRIWDLNELPIQTDVSDSLFSIVAPRLVAMNVDFGNIVVGSAKDSVVTGYVTNAGTLAVRVEKFTFRGATGDFSIISGEPPFVLEPGATQNVEIRFKPLSVGPRAASVDIETGAGALRAYLSGTGVDPLLKISSSLVDFGTVEVGDTRDTVVELLVVNTGTTPLTISETPQSGPDLTQFGVIEGGGGFLLQPSEGRTMTLNFSPTALGRTSGGIAFHYDGPGSPAVARLFGEGIVPGVKNAGLDAADVVTLAMNPCADGVDDSIVIRSVGNAPLVISSIDVQGRDAADFSVPSIRAEIAPGDSIVVPFRFVPGDAGERRATLIINGNAVPNATHTVELRARGERVAFGVNASYIDLGEICPGESRDTGVVMRNLGTLPLAIVAGAPSASSLFALEGGRWGIDTAAQGTAGVRFNGTLVEGEYRDTIYLADSLCGSTHVVALRANVAAPVLTADTLLLETFGGAETAKDMTLKNESRRDIVIGGVFSSDGRFTVPDEYLPLRIAAGSTMTLPVRYKPTGTAPAGASLVFVGDPCLSSSTVVTGLSRVALSTVALGVAEAAPGERVTIPLTLTESRSLAVSSAVEYTTEIRFDKTLLLPLAPTPMGRVEGRERVITVAGGRGDTVGKLSELRFIAGLGAAESTPLVIQRFAWNDTAVLVSTIDGEFRLKGICPDPTLRLFDAEGRLVLKPARPNPASGETAIEYETIEPGRTRLYLTDLLGRRVATVVDDEVAPGRYVSRVDLSGMDAGVYFYVLETPSRTLHGLIDVRR